MFFKVAVLKNFAIFTAVLKSLFNKVAGLKAYSVFLSFLLKLYTLLVRFNSLIIVFPQKREFFIYKPNLLIICMLEKREYRSDAY